LSKLPLVGIGNLKILFISSIIKLTLSMELMRNRILKNV